MAAEDTGPGFWENLFGAGITAGGLALGAKAYEQLGETGERAYQEFAGYTDEGGTYVPGLADKLSGMLEFQPYTVTSATGGQFGMSQDPETGEMSYNLATSPEEQALQQEQLKRAETLFGRAVADPSMREQEVLGRMEELASPERQRQRLELEQRLAAQGRLGTRTGMFGGTPEALSLERGIAEAQNRAALDAMQFTAQEQQRQAQMGSGMLAAGYVPQAQLLSAVQPGMTTAERQRQALSQQAGAYGETYASGLQALLQSGLGQADLAGTLGTGIAEQGVKGLLGGLFG
tara:strand:+ start:55 stop:924 length:870 start_codon:yes stop_codon:yes gene_type:complete